MRRRLPRLIGRNSQVHFNCSLKIAYSKIPEEEFNEDAEAEEVQHEDDEMRH